MLPYLQRLLTPFQPLPYTIQNQQLMAITMQNGFKIGSGITGLRELGLVLLGLKFE